MERLTEQNPNWINDEMWVQACEPPCEEIDEVYRKLKEYEDLEEQGLLLKLPCKVGDTVYSIHKTLSGKYVAAEVIADKFFLMLSVAENRFGKTVFLTRQEAEAALEKMDYLLQ